VGILIKPKKLDINNNTINEREKAIFCLQENGKYQEVNTSIALNGLPIALLELTLEQLEKTNNFNAAFWFSQQIINL